MLRSYPANFMELTPLFIEICSFETTQRQKRHEVTNGVKVKFLICEFVGCMKNTLFLANILFIILSMCAITAMEFPEKLTLIHFSLKFA